MATASIFFSIRSARAMQISIIIIMNTRTHALVPFNSSSNTFNNLFIWIKLPPLFNKVFHYSTSLLYTLSFCSICLPLDQFLILTKYPITRSHRAIFSVSPHLGHFLNGCLAINPQFSHSQLGILKVKYLHPTSAAYLRSFLYCSLERCSERFR